MPYPNKIIKDGTVLIDLTDSTVTPATLMLGTVAYGADGSRLVGEATGGIDGDNLAYGGAYVGTAVVGSAVLAS